MIKTRLLYFTLIALGMAILTSCGGDKKNTANSGDNVSKPKPKSMLKKKVDPMDDTGIGPVKELVLPTEIDQTLVATGQKIYKEKCTACHKVSKKFIGPSPKGILERRNPAWIMNMILNPDEMVQKNELAKKLLMEYNGSPMANQNLKETEARAVLEYFRTLK